MILGNVIGHGGIFSAPKVMFVKKWTLYK